jgi:cyclopropane fatty-acyl-phospholipid synthase-like methyltransferase
MFIFYTLLGLSLLLNAVLWWRLKTNKSVKAQPKPSRPEQVAAFYDQYNDKFLKTYGDIIQAFRTTDVSKLLDYQIDAIGLKKGQRVLDAGCGVCGPAIYFAQQAEVEVEALTVSQEQVQQAQQRIEDAGLVDKVRVQKGDFHQLSEYFPKDHFDAVYFLESFGHSYDHKTAIASAWKVLKPGGVLYIKDLFRKIAVLPEHEAKIDYEIGRINTAYRYNIADLYEVLHALRKQGFIISQLKTIDLKLEEFENLTISNDFQELTGIAVIDNWEDYVFPVDFFELKCFKPWYDISLGNSRYFLQNLYHLKVWGKEQAEL